jgi:predicted acetyltransferase/ribosomal protein S18 acetylase RimI-like enzyme
MREMNLELHEPCLELADSFIRMRDASVAIGEDGWRGRHALAHTDVPGWIGALRRRAAGEEIPEEWVPWVPETQYWVLLDGEVVGDLELRNPLNEHLWQVGGHIGYSTHPLHRRKGVATFALREGLRILGTWGLTAALATCRDDNDASIRTIENAGGRRIEDAQYGGPKHRRYLIPTPLQLLDDAETVTWRRLEQGAEYGAEDVTSITNLLHDAYAPSGTAGMNYSAVDQAESETLRRLRRAIALIGVMRDQIIATGTVYLESVRGISVTYRALDTAHFGQFAVAPTLQGTGIGGDLLSRLEAIAKDAGKVLIACDTAVPAQKLVRYYRRRGYEVVERVQWSGKTYQSEVYGNS